MGYSHIGSQSPKRASMLRESAGVFRRRFNLFAIKHYALQSWWYVLLKNLQPVLESIRLAARHQCRIIGCIVVHHRPGYACCFVCQRDDHDIGMFPCRQRLQPSAQAIVSVFSVTDH